MTLLRFAIPLMLVVLGCASTAPREMTQELLAEYIEGVADSASVSSNVVEFKYEGIGIACVSDATHDRMRLIAPIASIDSLQTAQLAVLLVANFHTTLDARYAVSDGVLYAAFLHPLSTLSRAQLESAIRQVAALSRNFGSTYTSDELVYGTEPGQST